MIEFVLKIIRHVLLILYVSFFVNLFVVGLFGEFIAEDKIAFQEFLVIVAILFPIYLAFLWSKK
jgi:hypothetical protein